MRRLAGDIFAVVLVSTFSQTGLFLLNTGHMIVNAHACSHGWWQRPYLEDGLLGCIAIDRTRDQVGLTLIPPYQADRQLESRKKDLKFG